MNFGLIIIGDEILSGRRQDQHLPQVIKLLAQRGQQLSWAQYIGDNRARITAVLQEVRASGDVVFSCGGIGATPDDHTRQCAAVAFGRPLVLHPQAKLLIEERMRDNARSQGIEFNPASPDNIQRLQMGYFPEGARIIPNPYNKIPGFSMEHVHFVPGFPVMAHPMMEWVLNEHYHALAPLAYVEKAMWVYGISEARLTPLMETIEREHMGVRVFSLPSVDHPQRGAHIELGVKGAPEQVEAAFAVMQGLVSKLDGGRFELAS